jgi:hypothetical protein
MENSSRIHHMRELEDLTRPNVDAITQMYIVSAIVD